MKTLLEYIKGFRNGRRANNLEKNAMHDAFLNDALEGYDALEGNHFESIQNLKNRILTKTQKKKSFRIYYAAASILLILSTGIYIYVQQNNNVKDPFSNIAYHKNIKNNSQEIQDQSQAGKGNKNIEIQEDTKNTSKVEAITGESISLLAKMHRRKKSYLLKSVKSTVIYDSDPGKNLAYQKVDDNMMMPALAHSSAQDNMLMRRSMIAPVSKNHSVETLKNEALPITGMVNFENYIEKNIILTHKDTLCLNKEIIVKLKVDSLGVPFNMEIFKSACPAMDRQLIELIKKGPKWTSGEGCVRFTR